MSKGRLHLSGSGPSARYVTTLSYNSSSRSYNYTYSNLSEANSMYIYFNIFNEGNLMLYNKIASSSNAMYLKIYNVTKNLTIRNATFSATDFSSINISDEQIDVGDVLYMKVYSNGSGSINWSFYFSNVSAPNDGGIGPTSSHVFKIIQVEMGSHFSIDCSSIARDGYVLNGWYSGAYKYADENGQSTRPFDFGESATIKAFWTKLP